MTDSDDDWFEKDIDDFVVAAHPSNVEIISVSAKPNTEPIVTPIAVFGDGEYGGCYSASTKKSDSGDQGGKFKSDGIGIGAQFVQPMPFKKLSYILDQTPLNIFLDIIQVDSGFLETLNRSNSSTEIIILTIRTILQMIETPFTECMRVFLLQVHNVSNYWKQIESILKETTSGPASGNSNAKQKKKGTTKIVLHRNDLEIWQYVHNLCAGISRYIPLRLEFVKNVLAIIESNNNDNLQLSQFNAYFTELIETKEAEKIGREWDIYPTKEELLTENAENYVQPNVVKGKFNSIEHYLGVQLSLLREDFIAPLRDGIRQVIETSTNNENAEKSANNFQSNFNVRVYPVVRIMIKGKERFEKSNFKSEHLLVDLEAKTRNNPASLQLDGLSLFTTGKYAKKLMFGSLLCFSTSVKFNDLIVAVVSNRDVDMLNMGYVQIEIVRLYNVTQIFDRDFIMFESEVYFESYRHVHHVLKSFTEESFPLRQYIINVDPVSQSPNYIPPKGRIAFTYKQHSLDLRNTSTWPTPAELKLNASQVDALKHALTNRFSVIQGPPGCGKTFIGLQIIATLLMNTDAQILIVCYTNHALDQFLSGLLRYTDSIVRIGNQSKNENLDRFNLKLLCGENTTNDKRIKTSLFKLKGAYAEAVQEFDEIHKLISAGEETEEKILERYTNVHTKLQSISRMQEEIKQIGEYQLIKSKRVIGITSTGAARCNALIRLLQTPIVLFEEAAEILESHIVAALTRSVQQLILIGDHQQLRPTTSVYKLAQVYHMDISLFERMINNNLHSVTLTTQYRMRTEIANLIRPMIYKELIDNENVHRYPNVVGMEKNLFFIDHANLESAESDETTKKNAYESQYLVALCNYLILQNYNPEDITILTTYNGQIFQFSQDRKKYPNLRKVRITVVDNFQGEDNKIILLSLVRSNLTANIGYLAFVTRICVALSRAKHGLYVIGNMTILRKASKLWDEIGNVLERQQSIGTDLPLKCTTHQNVHKISIPSDFEELKYGGCRNMCNVLLPCGHLCTVMCHTAMFEHFAGCQCNN